MRLPRCSRTRPPTPPTSTPSGIGLLVLYARRFLDRLPLDGRLVSATPVLSAAVIVGIGVMLTARALPGVV